MMIRAWIRVAAHLLSLWSLVLLHVVDCYNVCILGGTGRIGTAVAIHFLTKKPSSKVVLVGRTPRQEAIDEVLDTTTLQDDSEVLFESCPDVYNRNDQRLKEIVDKHKVECLINVAGPYLGKDPIPLEVAINNCGCRVYVDVSDPLDFIEKSLELDTTARESQTTALLCAGAFPGMSNVLAMEAASRLVGSKVKNLSFNYFTAGLGGSGNVNLFITNLGFGEPMVQYRNGELAKIPKLSGRILGQVDFMPPAESSSSSQSSSLVIGKRPVFAWPFPEAATVARELGVKENSSAAMGTAPNIWNAILDVMVRLIPYAWWKSEAFSQGLATFSEPLVKLTDAFQEETHAMRIDLEGQDETVSVYQSHKSFRSCVGQSCAEFAWHALHNKKPGVWLPETMFRSDREEMVEKLTTTPGTTGYSVVSSSRERASLFRESKEKLIDEIVGR